MATLAAGRPRVVSRMWVERCPWIQSDSQPAAQAKLRDLALLFGGFEHLRLRRYCCMRARRMARISAALLPEAQTIKMRPNFASYCAVAFGEGSFGGIVLATWRRAAPARTRRAIAAVAARACCWPMRGWLSKASLPVRLRRGRPRLRSEAAKSFCGVAKGRRAARPSAQAREPQQGRISRAAASASS